MRCGANVASMAKILLQTTVGKLLFSVKVYIHPNKRYSRGFLMIRYKKWLAVSIVFLAAAFIMPIYVLFTAFNNSLQQALNAIPNYASYSEVTGGVTALLQAQSAAQNQLMIVVIVAEALLIAAFSVTLWYAIKCRDQCRTFPTP